MISGRMDRRITIQNLETIPPSEQDTYGESQESWEDLATVWANVRQQTAREIFVGGKISEETLVFTIRHISGVTAASRVVYNSKNYMLLGEPREIGRKDGLEIIAKVQE